jgi:hypothetical protein
MDSMKCWRCWYSNGAAVLIDAHNKDDARQMAKEQAARDGYPGLSVSRVECLSE